MQLLSRVRGMAFILSLLIIGVFALAEADGSPPLSRERFPVVQAQSAPSNPVNCVANPAPVLKFAVIGDYGVCAGAEGAPLCQAEKAVAAAVVAANPDFVITVGDNNYQNGCPSTMEENVSKIGSTDLYRTYIENGKFFPIRGNHDYNDTTEVCGELIDPPHSSKAFSEKFGAAERYSLEFGLLNLYAIDSNKADISATNHPGDLPDTADPVSEQLDWLGDQLEDSTACWNMVYMHHSPYSNGESHGDHFQLNDVQNVNYKELRPGAKRVDAVFSGHDHNFEYLVGPDGTGNGDVDFFVQGASGNVLKDFDGKSRGRSMAQKHHEFGFLLVTVSRDAATYEWQKAGDWNEIDSTFTAGGGQELILTRTATDFEKTCNSSLFPASCIPTTSGCQRDPSQFTAGLHGEYPDCQPYQFGEPNQVTIIETQTLPPTLCQDPDSLIGAEFRLEMCCTVANDPPPFNQCYWNGSTPVARVRAYKGGVLIDQWPVSYSSSTPFGIADTGCVFDRFNLPDRWEVEAYAPWRVKSWDLDYYCCDCTRKTRKDATQN